MNGKNSGQSGDKRSIETELEKQAEDAVGAMPEPRFDGPV